jgi:4-alpha-glucanotransferase
MRAVSKNQAPRGSRSAGVLLHPTSLPGPYGIGDIGPRAHAWVEQLSRARQAWWQVLPLGPTGYADSPYQSFSAFAGNPNLLSPDALIESGLVRRSDIKDESFASGEVDYARVIPFKRRLLEAAWERFLSGSGASLCEEWETFCQQEAHWLVDFARFMALKDAYEGKSWQEWPKAWRVQAPGALAEADRDLSDAIGRHRFGQFLFFRQWNALKAHANSLGVRLIGDVPIFVAADSADVWANPELFLLDEQHRPRAVAGVPPDYFSPTGQLWGNPLYNWDAMRRTDYAWWVARLRATLRQVDVVRLDHFRGFYAYWEVPAGSPTAEGGRWVPGPGEELLSTLERELGTLPLIAEDLGVITPEVDSLRKRFGLPGMRILQFAFGGAVEERFLPHNFENPTVVYTGTHDNDTTRGWFDRVTPDERRFTLEYLGRDGSDIAWDLIRLAWASVARWAIAPLQDVLSLGSEARMNTPGRAGGNWRWRFSEDMLTPATLERLGALTTLYQRG